MSNTTTIHLDNNTPNIQTYNSSTPPVMERSVQEDFVLQINPEKGETFSEKFWRKSKEDPFVPIGFAATCVALTGGMMAMTRNDSLKSNKFMMARVGAQAFTLVAVVYGIHKANKARAASQIPLENK